MLILDTHVFTAIYMVYKRLNVMQYGLRCSFCSYFTYMFAAKLHGFSSVSLKGSVLLVAA